MDEEAARRGTLVAACVAFFAVIVATTATNVALKGIGDEFGATLAGLQWVVGGYTLVFASLLLTAGALGDRLGHRRVFGAGFAIFALASALCALAPALGVLIACQMGAGLGAALLVPASLALIGGAYPAPALRARAVGAWAAAGGAAIAAGPTVGGLLIGAFGWRGIFATNVLAAAAGLALVARFVAPDGDERRATSEERAAGGAEGLDPAGQLLGIAALGGLVAGIIEGGRRGWGDPLPIGALGLAAGATVAFLVVEGRGASPMLPLAIFRSPTVAATIGVGFLVNFGAYGQIFLLSLFFAEVRGYSPFVTGLAFLPMTLTIPLANLLVPRLIARTGPRLPMALGQAICGLGFLALAPIDGATPYAAIVAPLLAVGAGGGLTVPPMTAALLGAVPAARRGIASGVLNASRQAGGVVGVAIFGALVGRAGGFVAGTQHALILAGSAALLASAVSLIFVPKAALA